VLVAILVAGLALPAGVIAAPGTGAAPTRAAAGCHGAQAVVGGVVKCVRVGAKCQQRDAAQYRVAGLVCARVGKRGHKRLRLRRTTPAEARGGEVIAVAGNGKLTFQQAKWYFSQTVAHLPGVTVPKGTVGKDPSGTDATMSLLLFRSRLTRAQRTVLDRSMVPRGTPIAKVDPTAMGAEARAADVSGLSATLSEAVLRLRQHGVLFKHPIALYDLKNAKGTLLANTTANWLIPRLHSNECAVNLSAKVQGNGIDAIRQTLLHELMHCASGELVSNVKGWAAQPKFLDEGFPEWVSDRVGLEWNGKVVDIGWWPNYLADPSVSLFKRGYSAAGWWALLEHEGTNLFSIFPDLVHAGETGSASQVFATAVTESAGDLVEDDWGPTLAGIPAYGPRWNLSGPGQTHRTEPDRGSLTNDSDPVVGAAEAEGADEFRTDIQADVVIVKGPQDGAGFIRDAGGTDWVLTDGEQRFCTDAGNCACPDGTPLGYPIMKGGEAHVGFATESDDDTVVVTGQSTDDDPVCKGKTPAGITVLGQGVVVVTNFTSGTCSVKGGTFTAHATGSGGYALDVKITGFGGYGQTYNLAFGAGNPTFTVTGGSGPYSNLNAPPDAPPGGGAIKFASNGSRMSLGFIDAFNPSISDSIALAGGMQCKKPKKGK
jgi:hypothetical protein